MNSASFPPGTEASGQGKRRQSMTLRVPARVPPHLIRKIRDYALFFDVTAKKEAAVCSTSSLPHLGQATLPFSYSARVKTFENAFLQEWQRYS